MYPIGPWEIHKIISTSIIFLHTEMTQVVKILPHVRQEPSYSTYLVNIMGADTVATATQGASTCNHGIDYV